MKYTTFRTLAVGAVVLVAGGGVAGYLLLRPAPPPEDPVPLHVTSAPVAPAPGPAAPAPATATPAAAAPTPTTPGVRDVDNAILSLVSSRPVQAKIKDATKGQPFKVNLYSDDGAHWTRAKVDLDRDGNDDEKWTFKDGAWERKVSSADDGSNYDARFLLGPRGWSKK